MIKRTSAGQRLIAAAREEAAKWHERSISLEEYAEQFIKPRMKEQPHRNPLASAEAICPMVDKSGYVPDVWKRQVRQ